MAMATMAMDFTIDPAQETGIHFLQVAPISKPPPFFACVHVLSLNAWACAGALPVLFTFALWLLAKGCQCIFIFSKLYKT